MVVASVVVAAGAVVVVGSVSSALGGTFADGSRIVVVASVVVAAGAVVVVGSVSSALGGTFADGSRIVVVASVVVAAGAVVVVGSVASALGGTSTDGSRSSMSPQETANTTTTNTAGQILMPMILGEPPRVMRRFWSYLGLVELGCLTRLCLRPVKEGPHAVSIPS